MQSWWLFNIVVDLEDEFLANLILIGKFLKYLQLFASILILPSDVAYDWADSVDVIGHYDTAESLNEDEAKCFFVISGCDVSETHCKHDGSTPIECPNVLFEPSYI